MTYVRRDLDSWHHAVLTLLPRGEVWPRALGSGLVRTMRGLMGVVERWANDTANFLLIEAFPPTSAGLLPDWERVLGLPEPCFPEARTMAERRLAVREKLRRRPGAQDRAYFFELAERLGYHERTPAETELPFELPGAVARTKKIAIREYRPFMCGVSRCADPTWQVEPHKARFYWTIAIYEPRLTWFRAGSGGGRSGVDPMLRVRRATDLECVFDRLKPAHTICIYDYQGT